MAEKMVRVLMFSYGREVVNPLYVEGGDQHEMVLVEGLGKLGEVIDVTRPYDLERGERLGAFFSDEERKLVESGKYKGVDAPAVANARLVTAQQVIEPVEGEGVVDVQGMSAEEIADKITANKMTVPDTVALVPDDADPNTVNKVLDAENLATNNEPRTGVTSALDKKLAEATERAAQAGNDE